MRADFDWRLVRSFLAALDSGSLLGAARTLRSTQPTIGRHVAELESQLGVLLFERSGRGLLPTPMALRLAESARAMETAADQLARNVVSSNEVTNLLRREADIAVRMVQPDQASLVARRIGKITLGAYADRDYLRRRGMPRQPQDLLAHDLVGYDRDDSILRGFASFGFPADNDAFAFRTDDMMAYWQAVRAGLGIGFIADYVARSDARVQPVLPMLKIPALPVWLAVHREIRTSRRIRAVYDFLAEAVPKAL